MRRFLLCASLFAAACVSEVPGSELTGAGAGGHPDDGRFRPKGNGVLMSETDACHQLQEAFKKELDERKCVATLQQCPAFLRGIYQPQCMQYDQGTVQGCIEYFASALSCDELVPDQCVLIGYPETAPAGCP